MSISTNGIGSSTMTQSPVSLRIASVADDLAKKNAAIKQSVQEVASKNINTSTQSSVGKKLQYNVNEKLDQVVVKVVDPVTNEIVREIPSAEMQDMRVRVKDAIGNFIDETW